MNRRVRLEGINGQQIGDFEEINPGDWRGVDFQRSAGICIYTWQGLITRLADLIGDGAVYRLGGALASSNPVPFVDIDRARNIWLGPDYMAPHQYLPLLIPKTAAGD